MNKKYEFPYQLCDKCEGIVLMKTERGIDTVNCVAVSLGAHSIIVKCDCGYIGTYMTCGEDCVTCEYPCTDKFENERKALVMNNPEYEHVEINGTVYHVAPEDLTRVLAGDLTGYKEEVVVMDKIGITDIADLEEIDCGIYYDPSEKCCQQCDMKEACEEENNEEVVVMNKGIGSERKALSLKAVKTFRKACYDLITALGEDEDLENIVNEVNCPFPQSIPECLGEYTSWSDEVLQRLGFEVGKVLLNPDERERMINVLADQQVDILSDMSYPERADIYKYGLTGYYELTDKELLEEYKNCMTLSCVICGKDCEEEDQGTVGDNVTCKECAEKYACIPEEELDLNRLEEQVTQYKGEYDKLVEQLKIDLSEWVVKPTLDDLRNIANEAEEQQDEEFSEYCMKNSVRTEDLLGEEDYWDDEEC